MRQVATAAPTPGDVQLVGSNPTMGDGGAVRIIQGVASFERVDFIDNTVENVRGVEQELGSDQTSLSPFVFFDVKSMFFSFRF